MNLKKLLSTIGIISATITGSLNIVACNHTKSNNKSVEPSSVCENSKEEITALNTIKNSKFSITIPKGLQVENLYTQIDNNFISSHLSSDLKKVLNLSKLKLEDILLYDNIKDSTYKLLNKDLNMESTLKTKIIFIYKEKRYATPLTINITSKSKEILDKNIEQTNNAKINIYTTSGLVEYIGESACLINYPKELGLDNNSFFATPNTDSIRKIIKYSMRNYFANSDESGIKNFFKQENLKIKKLLKKNQENKFVELTNTDLNKKQIKIVIDFTYKNISGRSTEINLNTLHSVLLDNEGNPSFKFIEHTKNGRINILTNQNIADYICECISLINFQKELGVSDNSYFSTTNIDRIKKLTKSSMRNYFAKNDKSLIKDFFNQEDLKIKFLYKKEEDGQLVDLTDKDLNISHPKIVLGIKYKDALAHSKEINLNPYHQLLIDKINHQ